MIMVLRNFWLSDDAYISFKVSKNLVNGFGMRLNVAERVEAFSNPLWILTVAGVYALLGNMYFSALLCHLVTTFIGVFILFRYFARSAHTLIILSAILIFSKSFIDYSSSGLENSLANALLAGFYAVFFCGETRRRLLYLALLAAFIAVNRNDHILLVIFPLAFEFIQHCRETRLVSGIVQAAVGFLPLVAWKLFTLIYYGFVVPNSAYGKLNTDHTQFYRLVHAVMYFVQMLLFDPLCMVVICCGVAVCLFYRVRSRVFLTVMSLAAFFLYLLYIGADHMLGRFLTAPFFVSLILLAYFMEDRAAGDKTRAGNYLWAAALALVVLLGLSARVPTTADNQQAYSVKNPSRFFGGYMDEKAVWYEFSGLPALNCNLVYRSLADARPIPFLLSSKLRKLYEENRNKRVVPYVAMGYLPFLLPESVHVLDRVALCDPLLSRITKTHGWFNHFFRVIPPGYLETLASGENLLHDYYLHNYYNDLMAVTRSKEIFSYKRAKAIYSLNLGFAKECINKFNQGFAGLTDLPDNMYAIIGAADENVSIYFNGRFVTYLRPEASIVRFLFADEIKTVRVVGDNQKGQDGFNFQLFNNRRKLLFATQVDDLPQWRSAWGRPRAGTNQTLAGKIHGISSLASQTLWAQGAGGIDMTRDIPPLPDQAR